MIGDMALIQSRYLLPFQKAECRPILVLVLLRIVAVALLQVQLSCPIDISAFDEL